MKNQEETTGFGWNGPVVQAPAKIDAYRLVSVLASGGFGIVYRAEDTSRAAPVALKVLHGELASNAEAVARFELEVAAIRRVRHPNVIEVHALGRLPDGRPYFAMELLAGVSLKQHLEARGRLPADEALAILEPLCAAISAAHAQAIVHRDIKASNVFLSEEGGRRRVVLLDFGVAKLLDAEGPGLTSSRHVVGTVACMAPEQVLARRVDERTDVYALGALTYRMLTGEPPFKARSLMTVQQMHLYTTPRPPSALAPVSQAFNAPVLRALSKEPAARQPSAGAFLAEILEAAGRRRAGAEQRALAVHVDFSAAPKAMDAPGEDLLSDMEGIFPSACAALEPSGFKTAMVTGSSLLLTLALPEDPDRELAVRRGGVDAAIALGRRLASRPGRHAGVHVRICVHAGAAAADQGGAVTGGPIMELAAWIPELAAEGPLASAPALEGLGVGARVAGEAGGLAWSELPA